ncbi:hypothetical protein IGI04_016471 [Brassica rapa subsp. trilocularis]|uniref:Uncharacterized protein n=1 Tax=Brassica rapa subsp. trilocularis TaxID=1813537 RepID=A0ABQ7MWH1_BRACM|nr:hypothetical protein IGI04_016471 [Brassica rapa subsp. trilocularis]
MDGDFPMLFGVRTDIHAPNHHCKRKLKEKDWPVLDSELNEIHAVSKEFSELSIAYIPRALKLRMNSLAKGVRSRASQSAFVNPFAPSWLAPQASMRMSKKRIKLKVKLNISMNKFIRSPYLCGCLYRTNNFFRQL